MSDTTTLREAVARKQIKLTNLRPLEFMYDQERDWWLEQADAAIAAVREHLVAAAGLLDVCPQESGFARGTFAKWLTATLTPDAEAPAPLSRDDLGKIVRSVWIDYCIEHGDTKLSHLAGWHELSEYDREVDRRIGEAVRDVVTRAPVSAPVAWWMRNLPEGWGVGAGMVIDYSGDCTGWYAYVGPNETYAEAPTRDAALDAAVRAALEGKTE